MGWRSWLYLGLLAGQCAAALLIVIDGLPVYRLALILPHMVEPAVEKTLVLISATVAMQAGYWAGHCIGTVPHVPAGLVLGHIVTFLGRLPFMFGSAAFALIFFVQPPDLALSARELAIVPFTLFALYCLSRDLDRFAAAMTAETPSR